MYGIWRHRGDLNQILISPQQMVCRLQGSGGDAALAVAGTIDRLHFYKTSAVKLSIGSTTGCTITEKAPTIVLNVKALVGAFNQEKALEGAFSSLIVNSRTFMSSSIRNTTILHKKQ